MKYPKEAPVFRDRDPAFRHAIYEATDFRRDAYGHVCGLSVIEHYNKLAVSVGVAGTWCELDFLVPLTPFARDMLRVAKSDSNKCNGGDNG